jgi:hypothetical protein
VKNASHFLSYYHPRMPKQLAVTLQALNYNPHEFFRWVITYPNLSQVQSTPKKNDRMFTLSRLCISFFWWLYAVLCALYVMLSPATGIISLLVSPYMVILITYILALFHWLYIYQPNQERKRRKQ